MKKLVNKVKKRIFGSCVLGILLLLAIYFFGILLDPNFNQSWGYNNMRFNEEKPNSIDVLMVGSSYIYCNFSPMEAFNKTGLTSYVVAGPEQPLNISYDNIVQALKTQMPKVIFLEIKSLSFEKKSLEREEIDNEKDIVILKQYNKLKTALSGKRVKNDNPFYNFFTYHTRWKDLERENYVSTFKYLTNTKDLDVLKGYVYLTEVGEGINPMTDEIGELSDVYKINIIYLDKIYDLCKENNIELVFINTPNVNMNYFNRYVDLVRERYPKNDVIDMNEHIEEIGLDFKNEMVDWGHTNFKGAVKSTDFIIKYLEKYNLEDKRNNPEFSDWIEQYQEYLNIIKEDI